MREFLGLCNYFRASVKDFAHIASPLNRLLTKDSEWKGGKLPPREQDAFETLKEKLLNPPVLAYPNPKLDYHLMVDASIGSEDIPGGIGASLVQIDKNGIPKAIGFDSRGLSKHEKNYSAYLLEMQAACFGIQHFDVYLRGRRFFLHTDHKPLEKLSTVHTRTLNRLQQLMLDYNFTICYKPGKDNVVSDFLSRNPVSAVDVAKNDLVDLQNDDPDCQQIRLKIQAAKNSKDTKTKFIEKNGVLYFKSPEGKLAILAPREIRQDILQSAHNSLLGGHMGLFKTRARILERYYWPKMEKDLKEHISTCLSCQSIKPSNRSNRAPLVPLEQPETPNCRVHIDLFGPLTSTGSGKKYIIVMTDAFTKYVELAALPSKEAGVVAKAIFDTWISRYSTPKRNRH